jgi:hypothetical protein
MPFEAWLRGTLADVLDDTVDARSASQRGLLEPAGVERVRDRFRHRETSWPEPWLLMMLELWCREVLDTFGRPPARSTPAAPNVTLPELALSPSTRTGGAA